MNLLKKVLVVTLILFSVTGCLESSNDDPATIPVPELNSVTDVAASNADFSTLVSLLQSTGLDMVLDDGTRNFTVFAPTNAAFEALGDDTLNTLAGDPDLLSSILLYHVITSEIDSGAATGAVGTTVETANGQSVAITAGGTGVGIRVNTSSVTAVDIMADNGIIHVVDSVILPPNVEDLSGNSIATVARTKGLNTLLTILGVTGLDAVVSDTSTDFTIFAPTDAAFAALGDETIGILLNNVEVLSEIVLQHVIAGAQVDSVTAMSLDGVTVETASGNGVEILLNDDGTLTVGGSTVVVTNVIAENAIIHVIDTVIVGDVEIPEPVDPGGDTDYGIAAFTGAFGGATVTDGVYNFPASAEVWGGFANENGDMYPMAFPNGGQITFTASIPDAGPDTSIRFRFERLPFPDVDPAFETANVVISGGEATYTVEIPEQDAANTFSSFLLYLNDRDQDVAISNVNVIAFGAGGGSGDTDFGPAAFTGAFGGATVVDDVFTFPASAEVWGGFANENADLYPMSFPNGGRVTFTASIPDMGADTTVRFRFERLPFPDVDPAFETDGVVVSGAEATYTVDFPAQDAANTFSSFLMYIAERDQPVMVTNVVVTAFGGGDTTYGPAAFTGAFGGVTVTDEVFTFPASAEVWGGVANENAEFYPMSFPNGGAVTFSAAIPDAGPDTSIRFRFERLPFPDVDPAFETDSVTISGAEASYRVEFPAQDAANTYASFLMYINERDQPVMVTNVNVIAYGSEGGGSPELSANGNFEGGSIDPWFGAATIAAEDGNSYASLTTDVAGQPFSVNMSQSVTLEAGAAYTLVFDARATVDKSILAGIGLNEAPWYADVQSVMLTGTWNTFTLDVNAIDTATGELFGGTNDRIIFDVGAEVGTVHIDNVSLKKN